MAFRSRLLRAVFTMGKKSPETSPSLSLWGPHAVTKVSRHCWGCRLGFEHRDTTCSSFPISWAFSPREIHHTWFPIEISQTPPAFLSAHHNFCPKPPQQLSGSRRGTFQVLIPSPPSYQEERSSCECMEPLCCLRD